MKKPLIFTFIGIGIIFVGVVLYFSVFRDTWERDNLLKMSQMISEANQRYGLEEYDAGIQKYEELCVFIGDKKLKNESLRSDYLRLQEEYESLKEKIRAEKERLKKERAEAERKRKEAELARKKEIAEKQKAEVERIEAERKAVITRRMESKKAI